jgi:hypothetical protein
MNLSAQKIHSETIPDKQADKALMPENLSSLTLMLISLFWIAIILIRKKALKKDWKRK